MSYFDRYRDWPGDRDSTGGYASLGVTNRSGTNDLGAAHTEYPASSGHRPLPEHVTQARRRQVLIDGNTGQALADLADQNLRSRAKKTGAMASAVNNEIGRSASDAGTVGLGSNLYLQAPAASLPAIFFGAI